MMWSVKFIGLLALTVSSVYCNAREEIDIRVDAEQEPFESMTIVDVDGPKSSLFGKCLASAMTMNAKLYSIEIAGTTEEFIRHVPDFYELMVPVVWEMVTRDHPVSSILECAAAAYEMVKPMFKYNGGSDCKVSNRSYNRLYDPACETEQREAVFISDSNLGGCNLPGRMLNINTTSGTCVCVFVTTDLMSYDEADKWCKDLGTSLFVQTNNILHSTIAEFLLGLEVKGGNVSASNFFTAAAASPDTNRWYWDASLDTVVKASLYPSYTWSAGDVLYMKGTSNFTLDYAPKSSFKASVVCINDTTPL